MIQLQDIENEVRKNFVFLQSNHHKKQGILSKEWRVNTDINCKNEAAAIIVFVALSYMYGFNEKDVISHSGIEKKQYAHYLARFKQAANEYNLSQYHPVLRTSVNQYIIAKIQCLITALKLIDKTKFISLDDFEF